MKRFCFCYLLLLSAVPAWSQAWESVTADSTTFLWGEGWGRSVEEADREALTALSSRISVAVVSACSQSEAQVRSSAGDSYRLSLSSRTETYSSVTLSGSHREVIRSGRRAHVGRWIRRSELESLFLSRKERILGYEASALEAEGECRLDEALRCHYWAYVLLKALPDPGGVRLDGGRPLLNEIPERIGALLDGIDVRVTGRKGEDLRLQVSFRGRPVEGLDFSYFDGRGWSALTGVRDGSATVRMAPGALAETLQLRIEYAYRSDASMDPELHDMMDLLRMRPMRKSYIFLPVK